MRMHRPLAAVTAGLLAAGPLAACGSGGPGGSAGGGSGGGGGAVQTLTVGIPPVVEIGDLYTADSKGFFTSRGLRVTISRLNGGAALVPVLESGVVEIGQSNIVSVLQAQQASLGLKCFAAGYRSPSPSAGAELSLVASPKDAATITSVARLAGQTVAVNSLGNSNQLVAEAYLTQHGVSPASVHFVALAYPDMPTALAAGRVAAAITDEPFTTIVRAQGAKVLAAQPDQAIAAHPVYACWVAASGWLSAHRPVAAKFVAALAEADSYMAAHPAYLPSILPRYTTVSAQMAKQVTLPDFTTALTAADVEPWARAAAQYKITRSLVPPSSAITVVP
jgi:NitT/TauT family transport system substrate-binding protein